MILRLALVWCAALLAPLAWADSTANTGGDPLGSIQWPGIKTEFFGAQKVVFDERVKITGPTFAEDAMNVPATVDARALPGVKKIVVLVDRNPIRKVLEFSPSAVLPVLSFRFKLEQASPLRAAAQTADGVWHVGNTVVDAAGGGCTVSGASRKDGSWSQTLGQVQAKAFASENNSTRLKLRVMHPMDTGLVAGVPAFFIERLTVQDAQGKEVAQIVPFEPVSENPQFSIDLPGAANGPYVIAGRDNNGNKVGGKITP